MPRRHRPSGTFARALAAALVIVARGRAGAESPSEPPARADEAVEAVSGRYGANPVHRFFFGDDYRALWAAPVQLEVLDLGRYAGGLDPVRRVGGAQSSGLALRGADGRAYTFRGVEKDATRGLSPELQQTIAGRIAQDQVAAMHPGAALVTGPLLEAAGVLHVEARMVVMPDDPRLGPFRAEFANVLGTIQEFPRAAAGDRAGFADATEIVDGKAMLERLRRTPDEQVDTRAFLRARLIDVLLGDWDRHLGQWRWARLPGFAEWQPIPEDRDFAFCRFEGLVLAIARNWSPRWVEFGDAYPDMLGLTWQAWPLDRLLLSGLEREAWEEAAAVLQGRLTDGVIAAAVERLPEAYRREDGARLERALRARRDALPLAAGRFYALLAEEVRVEGTDLADVAVAAALPDGGLEVTISRADAAGQPSGPPWFRRRFVPRETSEVRLMLGDGADRFVARGRSKVRVWVVGGEGDDLLDDSAGGGTHLAGGQGRDEIRRGHGTVVDTRPYQAPPLQSESPWMPARDWGRQGTWLPWFGFSPEIGALLGVGLRHERYGFRTFPFASRQVVRAAWATGAAGFRLDYDAEVHAENLEPFFRLSARLSDIEIVRWFGPGNETPSPRSSSFYEVRQRRATLAPAVLFPLAKGTALSLGARVERAWTRRPPDRLVSEVRPYGSEPFGQAGLVAGLRLDTRDLDTHPTRGVLVALEARYHPALWDVRKPFERLRAEVAGVLTAPWPLRPTLALRVVGERVLGDYPFHEAAYVGGANTVRGLSSERFAGDAGLSANLELRLRFGRYFLVLPGEYGVFALADTGRVWLAGEDSRRWHNGVGGGFWFAYVHPNNTVTLAIARSAEGTGFYVRAGFPF